MVHAQEHRGYRQSSSVEETLPYSDYKTHFWVQTHFLSKNHNLWQAAGWCKCDRWLRCVKFLRRQLTFAVLNGRLLRRPRRRYLLWYRFFWSSDRKINRFPGLIVGYYFVCQLWLPWLYRFFELSCGKTDKQL